MWSENRAARERRPWTDLRYGATIREKPECVTGVMATTLLLPTRVGMSVTTDHAPETRFEQYWTQKFVTAPDQEMMPLVAFHVALTVGRLPMPLTGRLSSGWLVSLLATNTVPVCRVRGTIGVRNHRGQTK